MESVADQMVDIVEWYRKLPEDFTDINELMYARKQLSTLDVTLASEIGKARKNWKYAAKTYELAKNQKRIKFEAKGSTKADWYARANTAEELELATEWESVFWSLDYLFRSIREVLSEMNQRISHLKEERKQNLFDKD
jgi:hypothetical protein